MLELVDKQDLKSCDCISREGSSPSPGTKEGRKGRRWPRPPSWPAPQRLRTGKIRAGKKEVEKKRENLKQKNKTKNYDQIHSLLQKID